MNDPDARPAPGRPPLAPNRPRTRSGLVAFLLFFVVFALCAFVVVWLVTRPFRDAAEKKGRPGQPPASAQPAR